MKLQIPEQMAGVTGPCPECSATITAPQPNKPAGSSVAAAPIPSNPTPGQPQQAQPQPQPAKQAMAAPPAQQVAAVQAAPSVQERSRAERPAAPQQEQAAQLRYHDDSKPRARWMRVIFPLAFLIVAAALVLAVLQAVGMINIWDYGKTGDDLISKKPMPAQENPEADPAATAGGPADSTTPPTTQPDSTGSDSSGKNPEAPSVPVIQPTPEDGEFPELQLPPSPTHSNGASGGTASGGNGGIDSPSSGQGATADPPGSTPAATAPDETASENNRPASPPKAGFLANKNLNQFLEAKTLDERLALMSKSRHTRKELESSCLAGPLREVKSVRMVEMVPRIEDNMTQYLYFVAFEDPDSDRQRQRIVMQVVERPGIHPPRVHGDAFIEHYEKQFAKYAQHPNNEVTTFHCIAEARTADLAKDIPKELKKTMVRLVIKTHPHGAAMFDAYLNKNSPLMEHIGPRKDFPYTEPRFCVLSFRWNTVDPNYPYIELNDIVSQGWER